MRIVLITLIICLSLLSDIISETYKCSKDLELDTCYLTKQINDDTLIYVKGCSKGKKCQKFSVSSSEPISYNYASHCTKIQQKLDIDDKCELAEESRSGVCTSNKCAYIPDGGECTNNMNCGKNSYCQSKVCITYMKEKEECSNTKKCIPGLVCASVGTDATQSCVKRYSL